MKILVSKIVSPDDHLSFNRPGIITTNLYKTCLKIIIKILVFSFLRVWFPRNFGDQNLVCSSCIPHSYIYDISL